MESSQHTNATESIAGESVTSITGAKEGAVSVGTLLLTDMHFLTALISICTKCQLKTRYGIHSWF